MDLKLIELVKFGQDLGRAGFLCDQGLPANPNVNFTFKPTLPVGPQILHSGLKGS